MPGPPAGYRSKRSQAATAENSNDRGGLPHSSADVFRRGGPPRPPHMHQAKQDGVVGQHTASRCCRPGARTGPHLPSGHGAAGHCAAARAALREADEGQRVLNLMRMGRAPAPALMRIKLSEIRVVGRHRVSSVPPSAWSLPAPYAPLERAAQAAGHCGRGRGPALRALDRGRMVPYLDAHGVG
jgi:hypothetical protein